MHFEETKHALAMDLITKACHCYLCDDYVQGNEKEPELDALRHMITKINSGILNEYSAEPSTSPRRREKYRGLTGLKNLGYF